MGMKRMFLCWDKIKKQFFYLQDGKKIIVEVLDELSEFKKDLMRLLKKYTTLNEDLEVVKQDLNTTRMIRRMRKGKELKKFLIK